MKYLLRNRIAFVILVLALISTSGLLLRAGAPQTVGTWLSLGAAAENRTGAAAVALPDGRVLVTGGSVDGVATDSIVFFNAADGARTAAGRLLAPRAGHTATLLDDGRVLIAGGTVDGLVSADLEVFDPSTGISTLAASLAEPRSGHSAARLPDGRVLIAGGTGVDGVLDTTEVVDAAQASVLTTWRMGSRRTGASATALLDGRVLIAGGNDGTQDLASAEIFDPWTQTFEAATTSLSVARSGHTAVLLPDNNSVLIAGGSSNGVPQAASDLFMPAQFPDPFSYGMGAFAASGPLAQARAGAFGGPRGEGYAFVTGGGATDAEAYRFATVKTDRNDYAPGETAVITGSGWEPNSDVTLLFQEDPAVHADYELHVTADGEGKIYWDQWAPEHHDIGVRFYLLASDSRSRAQITFTDASKLGGMTVGGQSPTPVTAGNTATYAITVNRGTDNGSSGAFAATLSVTGLPSGASASFTPNPVSFAPSDSSKTATLTISTVPSTPAGSVTFTVQASVSSSDFTTATGILAVVPGCSAASVTTQPSSQTVTYGAASVSFTAGASGDPTPGVKWQVSSDNGNSWTDVSGATSTTLVISNPTVAMSGNRYHAVFTNSCGGTQTATSNAATLTVNPKALTITPDGGKSKTYGQTFTAFTGTVTGLVSGDAGNPVYASTGAAATAGVGSYDITSDFSFTTGSAANYSIQKNTATNGLTVNKAPVTATAGSGSAIYDGSTHAPSACAVTGVFTGDLTCANDPASVGPDAGTTSILPVVSGTGLGNFEITPVNGSFTIAQASSITTVTCPSNVTYNGAAQEPCSAKATGAGGLNQALTVSYSNNVNAGSASATAAFAGDTNHTASNGSATFTIDKAPVTATAGSGSVIYDGSTHAPSACAVTGTYTGDLTCANNPASVGPNAGTTSISPVVSGTGLGNFEVTPVNGSFKIEQAPSITTVTCPSNVTYNGAAQEPCSARATGAGGLDQPLTVTYSNNVNVGSASATAAFAGDTNHTGSNGSANFTIDKAPVTATAGSGSATYDGAAHAPSACAVTGAYTGNLTCANNPASVGPNAGTISISPVVSGTGLGNFDVTPVNGSFTIDKASSITTVTCPATAIYSGLPLEPCSASVTGAGGLNQTLTVTYTTNTGPGTAHATATFAGDANHFGSSDTKTFVIGFNVCPLYDQTKAVKQNATVPVKFFLCDVAGRDVSSSAIVVNAASLAPTLGSLTGVVEDSGNANPDNNFRFDPTLGPSGGYIFNLSTKGLGSATWKLSFTVGGQTFGTYELGFGVR